MQFPRRSCVAHSTRVLVASVLSILALALGPTAAWPQTTTESTPDGFTRNDNPRIALLASANELWIQRMYDVILRRPAESSGVTYWLGGLAAGGDVTRGTVATRFLFSREGAQGEVDRAYGQLLGRGAEPGGREFWTDYLTVHPVTVLRSNLLASDELLTRSGSIEAWLDLVYRELLGRGPEPAGLGYWSQRVREGMSRYTAVATIYYSPESLGRRVDAIYDETLARPPSSSERTEGATIVLVQDERRLRVLTLSGDEYFQQFLTTAAAAQ